MKKKGRKKLIKFLIIISIFLTVLSTLFAYFDNQNDKIETKKYRECLKSSDYHIYITNEVNS